MKAASSVVVLKLREELGAFLKQAAPGNHSGGGILGRAAEFLVSQRGL
jgi:hypothetical protein